MKTPFLIVGLLICALRISAQTIPNPTQTDVITIDNGTPGSADPNDRIRYTVTIQNTGGAPATLVQLNAVLDGRTTLVPGSFKSSPLAINDSYTSTGNVGISVAAGSGLKANDFDDNIPGLTIVAGTFATTGGGSITIAADGGFTYNPAAGFTGADTYSYTLTDSDPVGLPVPLTDAGTVTITVSNMIWFVDNTGGGSGGTGTLANPFKTLGDFNGSSGPLAGQLIFIKNTGTNYNGGIVLKDNQIVFGTGHTGGANLVNVLPFSLAPNSAVLPAINGTPPIITNTASGDGVTLASGNSLRGFNVGACFDFGMDNTTTLTVGNLVISEVAINNTTGGGFDASNGSGATMNVVFSNLSSTGGTNGIDLTSCAGTFTVNGGTITNPTGTGVMILNGSVTFSSSGVITDNSGFAVDVDNHDSNNVTFSGNITSTGTGIRVQNCGGGTKTFSGASKSLNTGTNSGVTLSSNAGATITINNGGLVITTTSGTGFNAAGGGTVTVTVNGGAVNTISSGSGTALNVTSTTIGANGLNFQSISANGGSNGIVLNTTGAGGLTVTGTSSTDGSGGTIQNITTRGAEFISANNISLKNMNFTNANTTDAGGAGVCEDIATGSCNACIYLSTVSTVTLDNLNITGTIAEIGINGISVSNLTFTNSTIDHAGLVNGGSDLVSEEGAIKMRDLTGTFTLDNDNLTFSGGITVEIKNTTGNLLLNTNNTTYSDTQSSGNGQGGLQVLTTGTTTVHPGAIVNVNSCSFLRLRTHGVNVQSVGTTDAGSATSDVDITTSTFDPGTGTMIGIDLDADDASTLKFNVVNNTKIWSRNGPAMNVFGDVSATIDGRINDNPVQVLNNVGSNVGSGIRANLNKDASGRIEVKTNVVNIGSDDAGIDLTGIGRTSANAGGATKTLNATVTGNNVTIGATSTYGIFIISASNAGDNNAICVNVANNTVIRNPSSIASFRARVPSATGFFFMEGFNTNAENTWNIKGNMPTSAGGSEVSFGGSGTFNTCTTVLPTNPTITPSS
ncbi:MAG: hypothetical protein IPP15_06785 [Saprospiraceae bacterium]|uniref:DUF11 domain-containing protein n=1 Tax=Candidatus Opimibacter skivensis TaxID=2982028 RepID=A0A9D7XNE2_9BACT|nr:hypothetical protein [Candidatus Opimibacter skivensis]